MSDTHPLHPSHTGRNECDAARVQPSLAHGCSNCQSSLMTPKPTFYCKQCNFVLCPTCANGYSHPAHVQHKLYPFNISHEIGGLWRCDACKRSNMDLGETQRYYCPICIFSLCKNCFVPVSRPLHLHTLIRTDVRDVYHASRGEWCCDVCRNNNGPGNYYPWHCKTCQFDICDNCCKPWISYHHQHPLFKADSNLVYGHFNGGWRCDICSISFAPQFNNKPYHCGLCKFDLCEECLRESSDPSNKVGYDVPRPCGVDAQRVPALMPSTTTTRGHPIASPVGEAEEQVGRPGAPNDAGECVICLEKPKDATIVHGATGHVCCCTSCALELERTGASCPICRAPIDRVIKQYTV